MPLHYTSVARTFGQLIRKKDEDMAYGGSTEKLEYITIDVLRQNRGYLEENLEIHEVLPRLRQGDIIDEDEYQRIQQIQSRKDKRKLLLIILFAKVNDNWVTSFLHIIHSTGQKEILYHLQRSIVIQEQGHGHRYLFRINGPRVIIENIIDDDLLEALSLLFELIDIYPGSIYLLLETKSKEELKLFLSDQDRLHSFLRSILPQQIYDSVDGEKETVTFDIAEIDSKTLLGETYGKRARLSERNGESCSECMLETIHSNYKIILNEIETDIMEKVLKDGTYIHDVCIKRKGNKSRKERADIFLNHVMSNENDLKSFMKEFGEVSEVEVETRQCAHCLNSYHGDNASLEEKGDEYKWNFTFKVKRNPNGTFDIEKK